MRNLKIVSDLPALSIDCDALTICDLPESSNRRWPVELQTLMLAAIDKGLITALEATVRYDLPILMIEDWRIASINVIAIVPKPHPDINIALDEISRLVFILKMKGALSGQEAAYVADPKIVSDPFGVNTILCQDDNLAELFDVGGNA